MRQWFPRLRRHRCPLPIEPPSFALPSDLDESETSFSCLECGQEWKLVWVPDIIEYTIGRFSRAADIGEWNWQAAT